MAGSLISASIMPENPTVFGELRVALATFTDPGTYAAGGYTLTASDYGMSQIVFVTAGSATQAASSGAHLASWDDTNQKLQIFDFAGAEIATTAASAEVFSVMVYGF